MDYRQLYADEERDDDHERMPDAYQDDRMLNEATDRFPARTDRRVTARLVLPDGGSNGLGGEDGRSGGGGWA